MKVNLYFLAVLVYFFFNSIGLPFGLTWMSLLAPVFYVWILVIRKREILLPFLFILLPFFVAHLTSPHVDLGTYAISLLNLTMVYIFGQAVFTFFQKCNDIDLIFRRILILNFFVCILAIPIYFTPFWNSVWMEQSITAGVGELKRLKLFTYEPSYYSLLFVPFFFYFLLQYFFRQNSIRPVFLLPMILLPLALSFSIGVLAAIFISLVLVFVINFSEIIKRRRVFNTIVYAVAGICFIGLILVVFFRDNPLFLRLGNIFTGEDTSGKGRTVDAFILAQKIITPGNEAWGVGLGQVKTMGYDVIRSYYLYYTDHPVAIPNAVAETLAIFGWVGVGIRFAVQVFFFWLTKPWQSYYRLLIFLFIFIYQFTGSYLTNAAEYVLWVIAFSRGVNWKVSVKDQESGNEGLS